jgi:hypothetical protein
VSVQFFALERALCRRKYGRWGLDLGIAQGKIEDLVDSTLTLELRALLKHPANPRSFVQIAEDGP